ncbi:MAG: class I SAM-dependent methyltransferase [Chloroflexota bacterium]|nr:class I SAM-dependent methyltransferase [Chloroflexota bacterium]
MKQLLTNKITRGELNKFLKTHSGAGKTLNIGSGGLQSSNYFPNVIGLDISKAATPDILGDSHYLPFKEESFDVILCTEVLEHLKQPQKAIDEMRRVVKRGGELLLTTRFIFPLHDTPCDYFRYTKYGLRYLLRDWNVVQITEETDTIGTLAVLLQRIAYQCEVLRFKPFKGLFHLWAHLTKRLGFIVTKEYGVFYDRILEQKIMTSGYYVVAIKM